MTQSQVVEFPSPSKHPSNKFPAHYPNLGYLMSVANHLLDSWAAKHGPQEGELPPELLFRLDRMLARNTEGFVHATYEVADKGWHVTFACSAGGLEFAYSFPVGNA